MNEEYDLARDLKNLEALKKTIASPHVAVLDREKLRKAAAKLQSHITATQRRILSRQWASLFHGGNALPRINMTTAKAALNGAAFGAAIAAFRICWNWTAWSGYRMLPFNSQAQLLYAYMVFWYALAGAVIFVVARNVLNSISWK